MLISNAWAQTAQASTEQMVMGYLPILLIVVVFYFLVLRPQNKRQNEHMDMIENIRRGDKVLTAGGFIAEVKKVEESTVLVALNDDTEVRLQKTYIVQLVNHASPADSKKTAEKTKKSKK